MRHDHRQELEAQIDGLLGEPRPAGIRRLRWTADSFAQGRLLDLLEASGFEHGFLPPLPVEGEGTAAAGSRFRCRLGGQAFTAYDADERVALAMAAAMALCASPRLAVIGG